MSDFDFDWIGIGGGAAGISIVEMLSRFGLKTLIVEKNISLASETTRIFHEWLHSGSFYTLVPERLRTTRYLLGTIDDLCYPPIKRAMRCFLNYPFENEINE